MSTLYNIEKGDRILPSEYSNGLTIHMNTEWDKLYTCIVKARRLIVNLQVNLVVMLN